VCEDGRIAVRHDHPGIRDTPTAWRSTWRPRDPVASGMRRRVMYSNRV
jgi:hypothetical protein